MGASEDWQDEQEAGVHAPPTEFRTSPRRAAGIASPLPPAIARYADLHARALAMMALRAAAEIRASTSRAAWAAMRRATGRLDALRLPSSRPRARPRNPERTGVPMPVPMPLPSLVAPLLAWTQTAEPAAAHGDALIASGLRTEVLFSNVVEPCARALDDGVRAHRYAEADVTMGLVRLQTLVRCIGAAGRPHPGFLPRSVLLAAAPGEPHALDAAIASECFRLAGWEVVEMFGVTDAAIAHLLQGRRFDALLLSLGRTDDAASRVHALRQSIDTARAAADDPRFVVLVCGRAFVDGGHCAREVGASAACTSAVDAPRTAERLLSD